MRITLNDPRDLLDKIDYFKKEVERAKSEHEKLVVMVSFMRRHVGIIGEDAVRRQVKLIWF